jgi:hypothetical protein
MKAITASPKLHWIPFKYSGKVLKLDQLGQTLPRELDQNVILTYKNDFSRHITYKFFYSYSAVGVSSGTERNSTAFVGCDDGKVIEFFSAIKLCFKG